MNSPRVSIIILNWNGLEDTIECLESMRKITYSNYEVIVVDNNSAGDDVRVLKESFGDYIHIIENDKNYGFAKGNNAGIKHVLQKDSPYVLLLNNDTVVDPEFLDELVMVAEGDRRRGIVCPMIYWYDQPQALWCVERMKVDLYRGICTQKRIKDSKQLVIESGFAPGAAMLIRRETLQKIGLLPESYFFGVEDIDYSINALRSGFTIAVATRARVWHKGTKKISSAGISNHYRSWQIMRRRYLSTPAYVIATFSALTWAILRSITPLFRYIFRGEFRELCNFFLKMVAALRGTIEGVIWRSNESPSKDMPPGEHSLLKQ